MKKKVIKYKRILCAAIAFALAASLAIPASAATVSVNDLKTSVEKQYGVRLDISKIKDFSDEDKISDIKCISESLAVIPPELHSAVLSYFKSTGQAINISLAPRKVDSSLAGIYLWDSNTIIMYTAESGFGLNKLTTPSTFAHEYGHMLHDALNGKYGTSKFSKEWTAFNGGYPYRSDYSGFVEEIFITQYASTNLEEDVADTFAIFTADQLLTRIQYDKLKDTSIWKKAMFLESITKSAFNISQAYPPFYLPQTPSLWAQDAVSRGFNVVLENGVFRTSDGKLYQAPISRAEFCQYLMGMLDSISVERYGQRVFDIRYIPDGIGRGVAMNIQNGKATLDFAIPEVSFDDCDNLSVAFANNLGIVGGVGNNLFNPNGKLTREQAAVILERACSVLGIADKGGITDTPTDAASISSWAKSGTDFVIRNGIMSGTGGGAFSPQQTYSYEQAYVTLMRIYDTAYAMPVKYNDGEFTIGYSAPYILTRNIANDDIKANRGFKIFCIADGLSKERFSKITWSSSNPAVATVESSANNPPNKYIIVTALSEGTVTITASDGAYSSSLTFTVQK